MAAETTRRGYNGNLLLSPNRLTIERGLKGLIIRHCSSPRLDIAYAEIREVRYRPSKRGWVGYLQLVTQPEPPDAHDFVSCVRDDRTVSFLRHADEWESVASEIARRAGVRLTKLPARSSSWRATRGLIKGRSSSDQDRRI